MCLLGGRDYELCEEIIMRMIKLCLVSFFVLFVSTAQADGEFIGPALRVEPDGLCGTTLGDEYQYWGTQ